MKKKTFGIVVVFAVIIIICAVIIFDLATKDNSKNENSNSSKNIIDPRDEEATGAFYDTEPVMKDYRVSIHSTEAGHPQNGSFFGTFFKIIDENDSTNYYCAEYMELVLDNEEKIDLAGLKTITINGKKMYYQIENSELEAKLYYRFPDDNGTLVITVYGLNSFNSSGDFEDHLSNVNIKVLESEELAGILNFKITKE